ncbi:MAG: glycosyltransferase [Saccharospirillaceae bacterium]|nr:glycosyltransferase [Saccharospirillaceae bacterium]
MKNRRSSITKDKRQKFTRAELLTQLDNLQTDFDSQKEKSRINEDKLNVTSANLKDAQLKYRGVTQSLTTAQKGKSEIELKLAVFEDMEKELQDFKNEDIKTKSENSIKLALNNGINTDKKTNQIETLKARIETNDIKVELEQVKITLKKQILATKKIKDTLSFQLGHHLIFSFKSWSNFISLPKNLLNLITVSNQRKAIQKNKQKTIQYKEQSIERNKVNYNESDFNTLSSNHKIDNIKNLKTACIMDEFTYSSYSPEGNFLQLTPQFFKEELEAFQPELLFIESAWRGKDDLWGAKVGHMSQEVVEIIKWCKNKNIPTIFWNKEDPIHFETFLSTAKLFDYIFTTDIDCVPKYKSALEHDRIFFLPFAAQPLFNNPIEKYERKDAFCFAGAYYVKYPERTKDLGNFVINFPEFRSIEIYDRNFGKTDINYQFPPEYTPFIKGSLPYSEIDKAYKGYFYSINLNSIKQSQSMFARRAYELLASNTITVSNFSRGLRLMFGDLVFTSDSGEQIVNRLKSLTDDKFSMRQFRLIALRKIMSEHTYQDRFAYIYSKISGKKIPQQLPTILVTAYAKTQENASSLINSFSKQNYSHKIMHLITSTDFTFQGEIDKKLHINIISTKQSKTKSTTDLGKSNDWISVMVPDDYYAEHYLEDLALATRYAPGKVIGKNAYYQFSDNKIGLKNIKSVYSFTNSILARASICRMDNLDHNLNTWMTSFDTYKYTEENILSIDEFSYCMNGNLANSSQLEFLQMPLINQGMPVGEMQNQAENTPALIDNNSNLPTISATELSELLLTPNTSKIISKLEGGMWEFQSTLDDGNHEYWYAKKEHSPQELNAAHNQLNIFLETTPGLNLQFVLLFLDNNKQRISHVVKASNRNNNIEIPDGCEWIRFGLRIYAGGTASISSLVLGHKTPQPSEVMSSNEILVLTNNYPSYDDLYKNAFVHSRVKAYKTKNINVDVFRFKAEQEVSFHEFEDIDVTTGSVEVLSKQLENNKYKHILVHFLDEAMWEVIKHKLDNLKVTVWVHGADIQDYHRRAFMHETTQQHEQAKVLSAKRTDFLLKVLKPMHKNLHLVFVSQYLADSVMEDLPIQLPKSSYSVIHNPINTDVFNYIKKPAAQRKKILSIRPYASKIYANDLAVKAVLELSKETFFNELEFRFIGDGILFEETLAPLREFENVIIERRFLTQSEIADLHKQYGVFLCPSRMDTQGVSRDEAMSSGLIPVTNSVAAIPEFVNDKCGFLSDSEDYINLAENISIQYKNIDTFNSKSILASQRVSNQSSSQLILSKEIALLHNKV